MGQTQSLCNTFFFTLATIATVAAVKLTCREDETVPEAAHHFQTARRGQVIKTFLTHNGRGGQRYTDPLFIRNISHQTFWLLIFSSAEQLLYYWKPAYAGSHTFDDLGHTLFSAVTLASAAVFQMILTFPVMHHMCYTRHEISCLTAPTLWDRKLSNVATAHMS